MPVGKIQFKSENGIIKTLSLNSNEDLIITNQDASETKNILNEDNIGFADINTLNGILNTVKGGTGIGTYTPGDLLFADSTTSFSKLTIGPTSSVLTSDGTKPVWGSSFSLSNVSVGDNSTIDIGNGLDMQFKHNGTDSFIMNKTGVLKIATETSGIPITIGHTTSEVTIGENLTVTGNLTVNGTTTTIDTTNLTVEDKLIISGLSIMNK